MTGSSVAWSGILSVDEFNASSVALVKRWAEINTTLPQWTWVPCSQLGSKVEGYLALEEVYRPANRSESIQELAGNSDISDEVESSNNATMTACSEDEWHVYTYHIIYSFSYNVPLIYFRGYRLDGTPLGLREINSDLPPNSAMMLKESKWTFMTQEDHPYLKRPWFMLHPCGTSEWMKLLLPGTDSVREFGVLHYLPAWLSVVGPAVGLEIPLQLYNSL